MLFSKHYKTLNCISATFTYHYMGNIYSVSVSARYVAFKGTSDSNLWLQIRVCGHRFNIIIFYRCPFKSSVDHGMCRHNEQIYIKFRLKLSVKDIALDNCVALIMTRKLIY